MSHSQVSYNKVINMIIGFVNESDEPVVEVKEE